MALTIKQEKFAQKFFELGNASAAYRFAYDAENMSAPAVWTEASKLVANPEVAQRVESLKAATAKDSVVTVESLVRELEVVRAAAIAADQNAAAVSAIMGKAKLLGLEVNKAEVTTRQDSDKPDLAALLAQVRESAPVTAGTKTARNDSESEKEEGESIA